MKDEYSAKYRKLRLENKWELPSEKFVEDILYEFKAYIGFVIIAI